MGQEKSAQAWNDLWKIYVLLQQTMGKFEN
jgi:hypothetical protein